MIKKLALLLAVISAINISAVTGFARGKDITILYVATDGSDANNGSKDSPFATVKKARDEIRKLKKQGTLGSDGAVVYLREGNYSVLETIEFTEEDSGTENAPIVYRGYPEEEVNFVGGVTIPKNKIKKTTDAAMLDKVINKEYKDKIYQVNLYSDLGMKEIPKMFYPESYGMATALNHDKSVDKKYFDDLMAAYGMDVSTNAFEIFVDGQALNNARYPDNDYMTIKKGISLYYYRKYQALGAEAAIEMLLASTNKDRSQETVFVPSDDAKAKEWATRDVSDVYIWWQARYGWADEGNKIWSIDPTSGAITCALPNYYGPELEEGNPVYIYNFFDEISYGEFFIDRKTGVLYMCLDEKPENLEDVAISVLETPMFNFKNVENFELNNIHMKQTRGNCVRLTGCKNVVIDNCEVSLTSLRKGAMYIDETSRNCGIKNSYFHDINGGIKIDAGNKPTLEAGNCYIINCEFENFARLNKTYTTAFHLEGVGNRAAYNEIHEAEHMAVDWGGNYQSMEFNEIYNVCTLTDDAAAMYAGRSLIPRGNVIKYNYIHDVGRKGQVGGQANGSHGVYLDDGYSSADIVGNVFENVSNYGVFLGGGRDNVVYNNVMIDCGGGIFCDSRYLDTDNWSDTRVQALLENTYWKNDIWKEAFPELYNLDLERAGVPANNRFENNLMYNSGAMKIYTEAQENGIIDNNLSTKTDPGFVDAEKKNYLLKEDAEVYSKIENFMPIPFTRMGRCIDRAIERATPATIVAINSPRAWVKGKLTYIDENENVTPVISNNSTYLPIRFLAESNGFEVEFNDAERNAILKSSTDELIINIDTGAMTKNGQAVESVSVLMNNGRTMLPMRAISELLGKHVFWDDRGFVSVSNIENLFSSETDAEIIDYLHSQIDIY